jgi:predicted Zn-dependent protease
MIDRRDLVHALERRELADWVVIEREQELAVFDERAPGSRRVERRVRWHVAVADDVPSGRGTARVAIDAVDGSADDVVRQAIALARAAIGPAWPTLPAAAPAKVALLDPALAERPAIELAIAIARATRRPSGTVTTLATTVLREKVAAHTKQGVHGEWTAGVVHVDAIVVAGARSLELAREARRVEDLELEAALATAAADLELLAHAGAPAAGSCTIVLGADAMLHGGLGLWQAFVDQADAVLARQGLARYRLGDPVAQGADLVGEPLAIGSDGALPFGLRSSPIGDDGDAVRRFAIVDRGIAVGLGLSPREAALRHAEPNGGVRNLVVEAGTWAGAPTDKTVEVRRLRGLAIDPYTSDAGLEIALGIDHRGGVARPFAGGTLRLDAIAALARARRSATLVRRGAYVGPASVAIDDVELIA